jgi:Fe-S cluster assembly iron-binding protein IscA
VVVEAIHEEPTMELSENAAAALEQIRQAEEVPAEHDTRLTADEQPSGDLAVRLEFVEQVPEDDQVAEKAGTEIYVDSRIAEPLAETVMDVQNSETGLTFVFRPQAV